MKVGIRVLPALMALLVTPVFAVEAIYLDTVPVTYPGEYLAPDHFYLQVPPPTGEIIAADTLTPATVFDVNVVRSQGTVSLTTASVVYDGYAPGVNAGSDSAGDKLRVLITHGLDRASDIPVAVLREHFAESETIELVNEGEIHDVLVEVETMKPDSSPIVFIVINAYKDVEDDRLIFYNNFGYLGELKLLSGSTTYATSLEIALEKEVELLQEQ